MGNEQDEPKEYTLESTYFSDGTRQLLVNWRSSEGERTLLFQLEDAVRKILDGFYETNNDND